MAGQADEPARDVTANREAWTQINAAYTDDRAYRAWMASEIAWGIFNVPESQLGVLGEVRGLDVVELGPSGIRAAGREVMARFRFQALS